tara:strand:- start:3952 stop:4170 length:219 start_codon:yes stop_codon:yes gene_type:complete
VGDIYESTVPQSFYESEMHRLSEAVMTQEVAIEESLKILKRVKSKLVYIKEHEDLVPDAELQSIIDIIKKVV